MNIAERLPVALHGRQALHTAALGKAKKSMRIF
jgi:hypothetical protein